MRVDFEGLPAFQTPERQWGHFAFDAVLTELKDKQILKGGEVGTAFSYLNFRNDSMHADWKNALPRFRFPFQPL